MRAGPLMERIHRRALAIAMKVLRNRDDAEDAVQDAMLKVWRNLSRFEGRASFVTWLATSLAIATESREEPPALQSWTRDWSLPELRP